VKLAPIALAIAAAGCSGPRYLGAPLPRGCERGDTDSCIGGLYERGMVAAELDIYDDRALRHYVQEVADRLAHKSQLASPPRILIGERDGTYATLGDLIVIGRPQLQQLGSEAELAGIVAHEMAHIEGRHAYIALMGEKEDDDWFASRRDAESVADERAVALLENAGYVPAAMPRALSAVLAREREDDEHPPVASRISDVDRLAGGRSEGFEGRNDYLQHLDRMIVGRDVRRGMRQGSAWVVSELGIAVQLPTGDKVQTRDARDVLHIGFGRGGMDAYMIGSIWGRELATGLDDRSVAQTALGLQTTGTMPSRPPRDDTPIGKVLRAQRNSLMHPPAGSRAVIIERPHGALVIELDGRADDTEVAQWLSQVRVATPGELAAAEPARLRIVGAPQAGTLKDLSQLCVDPSAALLLDDPARKLAAGDLFKCTDRVSPEPVRERETSRAE
jgi:hypothetical protein